MMSNINQSMIFLLQGPRALIALYNAVVHHMVALVTHPDLAMVSWPMNEFTSYDEGGVFLCCMTAFDSVRRHF